MTRKGFLKRNKVKYYKKFTETVLSPRTMLSSHEGHLLIVKTF